MEGLLFGAEDVLYGNTSWRRWIWQQLQRIGIRHPYEEVWCRWDAGFAPSIYTGDQSLPDVLYSFLRSFDLPHSTVCELEVAALARKRDWEEHLRPVLGVRPALCRLVAMGVRLAIVADSEYSSSELRHRLERAQLGTFFQAIVTSRDVQRLKPDPAGYQAALAELCVSSADTVVLGESKVELEGAKRLGMQTIGLNCDRDAPADRHIGSFGDLLRALALLRPAARPLSQVGL